MTAILSVPDAAASGPGWRASLVRFGNRVSRACTVIAAISLAVIVCINAANVCGRYFFSAPLAWAEELMLFLMVLTVFAGAASVTWRQEHIKIDAFVTRLPPTLYGAAMILTGIITLVAVAGAVYASFTVVSMLHGFDQRSDALEVPMWIPQSVVTIGLTLNALLFILRVICASKPTGAHGTSAAGDGA